MKKLLLLLVLSLTLLIPASAYDITALRALFFKGAEDNQSAEKMLLLLEETNDEDQALSIGYKGMAFMLLSKHAVSPFTKLKYFKRGKNFLEAAINKDKQNVELRFLRFSVQSNLPGFLNYSSALPEDKSMILKGIVNFDDLQFRLNVINYMLHNDACSETEKKQLQKI